VKATMLTLSLAFGFFGGFASSLLFHPPSVVGAANKDPENIRAHSFTLVDQSGRVVGSLTSADGATLSVKSSDGNNETTVIAGAIRIKTSSGSLEGHADFGSSKIDLSSQNTQNRITVDASQSIPTMSLTFNAKGAALSSDGKIRPIPIG